MKTEVPVAKKANGGAMPALRHRWMDPFGLMEDFDRTWKFPFDLFPRRHRETTTPAAWTPLLDMFQKEGKLFIRAELPGMNKEDMTVTLDRGDLVMEGRRSEEKQVEDEDFFRTERAFGTFYRRIPLGFVADTATIKAAYTNGVLEIQIPIPEEVRNEPDRIPIA